LIKGDPRGRFDPVEDDEGDGVVTHVRHRPHPRHRELVDGDGEQNDVAD
jgi:hypothetical protein